MRLMREGDRAASRQLLTTPEASPSRRPRRSGSEADLEAIASQLNSPTDVSDDAAIEGVGLLLAPTDHLIEGRAEQFAVEVSAP